MEKERQAKVKHAENSVLCRSSIIWHKQQSCICKMNSKYIGWHSESGNSLHEILYIKISSKISEYNFCLMIITNNHHSEMASYETKQ